MKKIKIGNLTLAITLITIGCIALARNFMGNTISPTFVRKSVEFWPAILLLLGAEIFIKQLIVSKNEGNVTTSLDGASIFVLILVLIAANIFAHSRVQFDGMNWHLGSSHVDYTVSNQTELDVIPEAQQITVMSRARDNQHLSADVHVSSIESNTVRVDATITGYSHDELSAQKLAEQTQIKLQQQGDVYEITVETPSHTSREYIQVELDIQAPPHLSVNIQNQYGEVVVSERQANVEIDNAHGHVVATDVNGEVQIDNSYGSVKVEEIGQNTKVENIHGSVEIRNANKDVVVYNSYGPLTIEKVGGTVEAKCIHGRIYIRQIVGDIELVNSYNRVEGHDIEGSSRIRGEHSEIDLQNVTGPIDVETSYENVSVHDFQSDVTVAGKHCSVYLSTNTPVNAEIEVDTTYDDIELRVPRESNIDVEARCSYGTMKVPSALYVEEDDNEAFCTGPIGTGENSVELETTHGDVIIVTR